MLRLVEKHDDNTIHVSEMEDGDVAVIISWGWSWSEAIGQIIQRYKNTLIVLGMPSGQSYTSAVNTPKYECPQLRVRLLEDGELLCLAKLAPEEKN